MHGLDRIRASSKRASKTATLGGPSIPRKSYSIIALVQLARNFGMRYRHIAMITLLSGVATAVEGLSLVMVVPVIDLLQHGGDVASIPKDNKIWQAVTTAFHYIDLPVALGSLLTVMFVFIVLRQAFRYVATVYTDFVGLQIISNFRRKTFSGLLQASFDFYDQRRSGNILNDLTVELPYAVNAFLSNVRLLSLWAMMIFYGLGALFLSPQMSLVALAVFALIGLVLRVLLKEQINLSRKTTHANQGISSNIVERIRGIRLVRLSGTEAEEKHLFEQNIIRHYAATFSSKKLGALIANAIEPVILGATLFILYFGVNTLKIELSSLFLLLLWLYASCRCFATL